MGVGEVFAQLGDRCGGALGGERVEADGEGVGAGDDVPGQGQCLADEGVGLLGGAGVAGVDSEVAGQGGDGVERGDPDGMGNQFGLDVEDLLTGVHIG